MAKKPLTPKQARFVEEYLIDLNATQAAKRAGYSPKWADRQAHKLVENGRVAVEIAKALRKRSERTEITQDMVLTELWRIAGVDLSAAYNEKGHLLPIHEMPEDVRRVIAGLESAEEFDGSGRDRKKEADVRKVKTWDKVKALELCGKHLAMFTDKLQVDDKRVKVD